MSTRFSVVGMSSLLVIVVAVGLIVFVQSNGFRRTAIQGVDSYTAGGGFKYCGQLAEEARALSSRETLAAWIAALLGGGMVILGNVLDPAPTANHRLIRHSNVLVLNVGLLLLLVSHYVFSRADAASLAASSAS